MPVILFSEHQINFIVKKIFFAVALFATAFVQQSFAQAQTTSSQFSQLLQSYYNIKDALVTGSATTAAAKAKEFIKNANGISNKDLSQQTRNALLKDAVAISTTTDIKEQRELFASFS